jgi:CRP/FNR family transcriptional regulator, cyclic AMP receptor protein
MGDRGRDSGQKAKISGEGLAAIRQAFGCDATLAVTIAGMAREGRMARGSLLWPLPDRDETTLLTVGRAAELAYGREGAVLVLHSIAPGEFYGSLLGSGGGEGGTQVEAVVDSAGAHFSTATVLRLMEGYSCVALALARQMAARIEAMRRRMVESALLSATGRIAAELLRQARAAPDRTIRPVPVWAELAVQVQSSRETVSRAVSQWEKRGLVKRVEGGLLVVAPHRLEELVY